MYNPTPWKDHVTNPSNCFNITKNDDDTYQITRAGTVMQQGTPQDAAHFTNQEDGIWELFACYGLLLNYARQMGWDVERGSINLTNTAKPYPFNNSQMTAALSGCSNVMRALPSTCVTKANARPVVVIISAAS